MVLKKKSFFFFQRDFSIHPMNYARETREKKISEEERADDNKLSLRLIIALLFFLLLYVVVKLKKNSNNCAAVAIIWHRLRQVALRIWAHLRAAQTRAAAISGSSSSNVGIPSSLSSARVMGSLRADVSSTPARSTPTAAR